MGGGNDKVRVRKNRGRKMDRVKLTWNKKIVAVSFLALALFMLFAMMEDLHLVVSLTFY